jgi:hypothetical protein
VLVRAIKVTLKYLTARKHREIAALLEAYRAAVNFFLPLVWKHGLKLNSANSALLEHTRLTVRYRDQALKEAVELVAKTRKSAEVTGNTTSCPVFHGRATLDDKFADVERGEKSFDLVVRLSTLNSGTRISIPTRRTKVLKKWLRRPGAVLVQGCGLSEKDLVLWVTFPAPAKPEASLVTPDYVLGIDVGVVKLIATSEGEFLGTDFRVVRDKIKRKMPGGKAKQRARTERDNLVNYCVKRLPWDRFKAIGHEDLRGIKRGKKRGRGKSFRRAMNSWRATAVVKRIEMLAEEQGKWRVPVNPRNSSRECPECHFVHKSNRKDGVFFCLRCGYLDDSDHVGSLNVKTRAFAGLPAVVEQARLDALEAAGKTAKKAKVIAARAAKQRVRYAEKRAAKAAELLKSSGEAITVGGKTRRPEKASATHGKSESARKVRNLAGAALTCAAPGPGLSACNASSENPEGEYRSGAGKHTPGRTRADSYTSGQTLGRSAVESPSPKKSSGRIL